MDNFHLSRALAMLLDRERLKVRPPLARAPVPELAVGVTSDLVRKCAISNTASRLLGGDTMHALCKLPRDELQQKASKLTNQPLKRHRERWCSAAAVFIDEISMVSRVVLQQIHARLRE